MEEDKQAEEEEGEEQGQVGEEEEYEMEDPSNHLLDLFFCGMQSDSLRGAQRTVNSSDAQCCSA